jgi:glycosyltransferase involved in cell wall biosynthesis
MNHTINGNPASSNGECSHERRRSIRHAPLLAEPLPTTPATEVKSASLLHAARRKAFRVLHIVPRLFGTNGTVGGAERYALELARYMANEVPTALVCFGDETESHEKLGQLPIHVIDRPWCVRGQAHNPMSLRLWRDIRQAQIIHCHQQHILASSFAAAVSRLSGRKVFVSDLGGGGWDVSAYVPTDRWYHGHLHISQYSRSVFELHDRSWAHVILGGVDVDRFSPDPTATRQARVVFVGRLMPHKGVDDLIRALPGNLELEIIGQPYNETYVDDLKRLAEGKRVMFRHDCSDQAIVEAYRRALCVVLPSVYRSMYGAQSNVPELLGQTLLEGMACGTPAICTDVASMPEVVADGVTGFVIPPNNPQALGEKLAWLASHPEQAEILGQNARRHVLETFTWPLVVRRCLDIYGSQL